MTAGLGSVGCLATCLAPRGLGARGPEHRAMSRWLRAPPSVMRRASWRRARGWSWRLCPVISATPAPAPWKCRSSCCSWRSCATRLLLLALRPGRSGYPARMACPELPDSARVRIELEVSGFDAARIDEVVTRPEFAGWTRGEWCVEIIRTALRYYVREAPAGDRGQEPAEQSVAGRQEAPATPSSNQTSTAATPADGPSPDGPDNPGRPVAAASEPVANPEPMANPEPAAEFQSEPTAEPGAPECAHPAGARDYETGTCAACGAILWD
jgi:hypothetical protein